ncbi:unnamed protein product [Polarella glacialis]|uniref:Uncharacterized protein n=1 Tax=Polarella glacialis TaxID=89957 RepID=A0A813JQY1_POLGL|nr:unnamed protein product [Polarella glacialis]
MWTPHASREMGWPMCMEDYSGSPLNHSPMSGADLFQYANPPIASPFADAAAHACHFAPALETQVQSISSRVQKLERSRGQITKDIADMINETRELQKRVGIESQVVGSALFRAATAQDAESLLQGDAASGLSRRQARLKTAPASSLPQVPEEPALMAKSQTERILPPPGLLLPESLVVKSKEIDGVEISRIEWRIDNVKAKFKDCVGRPLVSPQFRAGGIAELRLMVFPNLGLDVAGLTMREQKARYEARIAEGPLSGALKFKVVTQLEDKLVISFNLFVGEVMEGPLEHNFADHVIHGLDFSNNWLEQVGNGSLVVGVEVLTVNGQGSLGCLAFGQ